MRAYRIRRRAALVVALTLVAPVVAARTATGAANVCRQPGDPAALILNATGAVRYTEEPNAGGWRPWFVAPADVDVAPPPALTSAEQGVELAGVHMAQNGATDQTKETVARYGTGAAATPWSEDLLALIRKYSATPGHDVPRFSRQIALFEIAMEDALIATWNVKYCYLRPAPWMLDRTITPQGTAANAPSYPSERGTAAGVASVLLATFFPEEPAASFDERAWQVGGAMVASGQSYRSDVEAGIALGRSVARRVLKARADDGADAPWDGKGRVTGPCRWSPTPPAFRPQPVEPGWGKVRPFVLSAPDTIKPPPPPACDSNEAIAAARDLYETSLHLTDREREIAQHWDGGPGTETPVGLNLEVALDAVKHHALNSVRGARVLANVAVAMVDAGIACWSAKFTYWTERPVHTIRRMWDPTWTSLLVTPPFPGYVSGHSSFSSATATVLGHFFPEEAERFRAVASEAAQSRFYGGIHIRQDNEQGLSLGAAVAQVVVDRAAHDGAD